MAGTLNPKNWGTELDSIEKLCRIKGMNPSRLLKVLDAGIPAESVEGRKNELNRQAAEKLGWRHYNSGGAAFRVVAVNNRYGIIPSNINNELVVPTVADLVDEGTKAIVELGCGIGRHLFHLRDLIEHKFPHIKYFGCEVSDTGLSSGKKIAALEPGRDNISFQYFNYLEPRFEFLGGPSDIIFFTCHSIEQVDNIGENLFHEMLSAGISVRCVHCEPVGWQFNDELMSNLERDGKIHVPENSVQVLQQVSDHFSANIPVKLGWNRNLVKTLRSLESNGAIKIDIVDRNCAGNSYYNPSTLIQWTKC